MWSFGVILFILLGGYPPFHDNDQKQLYRKIRSAAFDFHPKYWSAISEEAKDLIRHLLCVNPLQRYNVDQALAHPWLHVDDHLMTSHLQETVDELKKFQAARKLKAGINAVVAVSKLKKIMSSLSNMRQAMEEEILPHTLEARYELGEVLGEGGYAVVRSGISKRNQKEVAIKVMNRSSIDPDTEASIRNEVSVLQTLEHPHIVRAFELFEEPEQFYFVLEKINGGELFDRIVKKTFYSEVEARQLAASLLDAIKYCHANHIAHRCATTTVHAHVSSFSTNIDLTFFCITLCWWELAAGT
jgi:calcium/calmodulin-dependent protein kinase (CaM kinase) II/calcium/calmodulin-dependent protein kinase I